MPYSDMQGKDTAREWYDQINPRTVVDVGAGSGTYVHHLRNSRPGPDDASTWTAVEAWGPYVEQFSLDEAYDRVIVADARYVLTQLFMADLVITGDVLEHMSREEAVILLDRIRLSTLHLIVSVPVLHLDQDAVYGNPFERHVEHWSAEDMLAELSRHGKIEAQWTGDVLAYFWWSAT